MTNDVAVWRLSRQVLGAPSEHIQFLSEGDLPAEKAIEAFRLIVEQYIPTH